MRRTLTLERDVAECLPSAPPFAVAPHAFGRREAARVIVPDVNLLVRAYNSESPAHHAARAWWESLLNAVGLRWANPLARRPAVARTRRLRE